MAGRFSGCRTGLLQHTGLVFRVQGSGRRVWWLGFSVDSWGLPGSESFRVSPQHGFARNDCAFLILE